MSKAHGPRNTAWFRRFCCVAALGGGFALGAAPTLAQQIQGKLRELPRGRAAGEGVNVPLRMVNLPQGKATIGTVVELNKHLSLTRLNAFPSLDQFRTMTEGRSIRLKDTSIDVRLSPYVNSISSLGGTARRITPQTVQGSLTGEAELFQGDGTLLIVERLRYQGAFNTCSIAPGPASGLCFGRPRENDRFQQPINPRQIPGRLKATKSISQPTTASIDPAKKKAKEESLDKLSKLFKQAAKGKNKASAQLPGWAQQLSEEQYRQLAELDRDALERVVLNNAKVTITRGIKISKPSISAIRAKLPMQGSYQSSILNANQDALNPGLAKKVQAESNSGAHTISNGDIYITGFTFAENIYWSDAWEFELDYGVDSMVILIQPFAEAWYGFGLRFPLSVKADFITNPANGQANLKLTINPKNGSTDDYIAASLSNEYLFSGQELVAEAGAAAGITYMLPIIGYGQLKYEVGFDLTDYLNGIPNGQLTPPTASPLNLGTVTVPIDLLGGIGDYHIDGVGGIEFVAYPGIKINLQSDGRGLTVRDHIRQRDEEIELRSQPMAVIPLSINNTGLARFSIKDPYYQAKLVMVPGIKPELTVGILTWEQELLNTFIELPALAISIPSQGVSFGCHSGTICERVYEVNTKTGSTNSESVQSQSQKKQKITLKKYYKLRDDEGSGAPEYANFQSFWEGIISRNKESQSKRSANFREPRRCAGGEVAVGDWDRIKVDANGKASFYVSIQLFEGTHCATNDLEAEYRGVGRGGNDPAIGPALLVVPPGETRMTTKRVESIGIGGGDYVEIKYVVTNETIE